MSLDSIQPESFKSDAERYKAKEAAKRLLLRLETPFERAWALAFENPVLIAGLQFYQDLGIWTKWAVWHEENAGGPRSLEDIISTCNGPCELNLLRK